MLVVVLVLGESERFTIGLKWGSLPAENANAPRTSTTTRTRTIPKFRNLALKHRLPACTERALRIALVKLARTREWLKAVSQSRTIQAGSLCYFASAFDAEDHRLIKLALMASYLPGATAGRERSQIV